MAIFNKEEYMRDLEALVNIDSGSGDIDGLNKVADFICAKYESIGLVPVRTQQGESGRPYVEVFTHPEAEEVDVLFLGHLDTVFDKGTVAERPFTLSEDGKVACTQGTLGVEGTYTVSGNEIQTTFTGSNPKFVYDEETGELCLNDEVTNLVTYYAKMN